MIKTNKISWEIEARVLGKEEAKASGIDFQSNEDISFIGATLCHEGANYKGDRFLKEELEKSYKTIVWKPINWEHTEPNIGTVLESSLIKEDRNRVDIVGAIWAYKYPQYAKLIKEASVVGTLKVSMEALFSKADYVIGEFDEVIPEEEADDEIKESIGKKSERFGGRLVSRAIKDFIFCGVGITSLPADKDAVIWAFASDKNLEEYHEYLHKAFRGEIGTMFTPQRLVEEHQRVHEKLAEKFLFKIR